MHREQIDKFIKLMPKIINFFKENLEDTSIVQHIIKLLNIYPQLDSFIQISKVTNHQLYQSQIINFKHNLIQFQEAASETIYTNKSIGDSKFFYGHILFYYYPILVNQIWNKHKLGIGIFNLQGMERRNKESKEAARRFYNGKHNVCNQTMNRMFNRY